MRSSRGGGPGRGVGQIGRGGAGRPNPTSTKCAASADHRVECGYNPARVEPSSKSLRSQTLAGQQICELVFFQLGFFFEKVSSGC